jgi:hypothetical protein
VQQPRRVIPDIWSDLWSGTRPIARPIVWPIICAIAGALGGAACGDTIDGNQPIGTAVDTDAQIQRYLRRVYLDLPGHPPSDGELTDATARLHDAANTAAARGALVDELIADDAFAKTWLGELENGVFGGNSLAQQYALVCGLVRAIAPPCMACTEADACACACAAMQPFNAERTQLRTSQADLDGGTHTATIERRYAMASGYFVLAGAPEIRVKALFDDFLSRTAESDEIENGRAMIVGSLFPGSPAGLLFHRYGSSYADPVDIVFHSEVYREAMVRRAFERYLARAPSAAELAHFVTTLGDNVATDPDARGLVRAVVSSREYFEQ